MRYYDIEVAGTKRALKLCPINQDLCIAAFLILGDTELTVNCAAALLERAPKYDFLLTAEAKSIPLVQEMARQNGDAHYIVARKGRKHGQPHLRWCEIHYYGERPETLC